MSSNATILTGHPISGLCKTTMICTAANDCHQTSCGRGRSARHTMPQTTGVGRTAGGQSPCCGTRSEDRTGGELPVWSGAVCQRLVTGVSRPAHGHTARLRESPVSWTPHTSDIKSMPPSHTAVSRPGQPSPVTGQTVSQCQCGTAQKTLLTFRWLQKADTSNTYRNRNDLTQPGKLNQCSGPPHNT